MGPSKGPSVRFGSVPQALCHKRLKKSIHFFNGVCQSQGRVPPLARIHTDTGRVYSISSDRASGFGLYYDQGYPGSCGVR